MRYIKAPASIADRLGLKPSRNRLPDGAYLLWDRDLMPLTGSGTLDELLPLIGAIELTPGQLRDEQLGLADPVPLPEPTADIFAEE